VKTLLLLALTTLCFAAPVAKLMPVDEAAYPKTVAAAKGKVLLVNFWATWCAPCREEMPALVKLSAALKPKGLEMITISADEPEDEKAAVAFLNKAGVAGTAYIKRAKKDDTFIGMVDAKWQGALPAIVLYDKTGKKVKIWIGEADLKQVEAEAKKLL
jgi:thiol-disulfide isomerase/thioredoxin